MTPSWLVSNFILKEYAYIWILHILYSQSIYFLLESSPKKQYVEEILALEISFKKYGQ